jgi:hypothetical protein
MTHLKIKILLEEEEELSKLSHSKVRTMDIQSDGNTPSDQIKILNNLPTYFL